MSPKKFSKIEFYKWALQFVPDGQQIVAINYLAFENKYVAILATKGSLYPFIGKIYEPD